MQLLSVPQARGDSVLADGRGENAPQTRDSHTSHKMMTQGGVASPMGRSSAQMMFQNTAQFTFQSITGQPMTVGKRHPAPKLNLGVSLRMP